MRLNDITIYFTWLYQPRTVNYKQIDTKLQKICIHDPIYLTLNCVLYILYIDCIDLYSRLCQPTSEKINYVEFRLSLRIWFEIKNRRVMCTKLCYLITKWIKLNLLNLSEKHYNRILRPFLCFFLVIWGQLVGGW